MCGMRRGIVFAAVVATALSVVEKAFAAESNTHTTKAVSAASATPLDAEGILAKMKEMDARFEAGFTVTGIYHHGRTQKKKWKMTMGDGKIAYDEEVIEILGRKGARGLNRAPSLLLIGRTTGRRGGVGGIVVRRTIFANPEYYGVYDWVCGSLPEGPLAPRPEGETRLGTNGSLTVYSTGDPAHDNMDLGLWIPKRMLMLGRWYSKYIDRITAIHQREDGLTSFTAEGTKYKGKGSEYQMTWEIVADPRLDYMVRRAKLHELGKRENGRVYHNVRKRMTLLGLMRDGPLCIPESAKGVADRHTSFSAKAARAFLEKAGAVIHGPYIVHTDFHDRRGEKERYRSIKAGGAWPRK